MIGKYKKCSAVNIKEYSLTNGIIFSVGSIEMMNQLDPKIIHFLCGSGAREITKRNKPVSINNAAIGPMEGNKIS